MTFVDRGVDVNPVEAGDVAELKEMLGKKFVRLKGSWEKLLQSALYCDESVVFVDIAELVEVTEGTQNEALFGAEDLLQSLHDRDLCDWVGVEETDSAPEAGGASEMESEEADWALAPRGEVNTKGSGTTEDAFFCFAYDAADGAPEPVRDTSPLGAATMGTKGAPRLEIPCWTKTTVVAEETPPTNTACVTEAGGVDQDDIPVSDGGNLGRCDGLGQKQVGFRGTGHARNGGQGSSREGHWDIGTVC
jgi:hypothetical protein